MAPNFLSKLVNKSSPVPSPQRSSTDARSSSRNPSPVRQVSRSQTTAVPSPNPSVPSLASSNGSHLDVNVVPPSPSSGGSAVHLPDGLPPTGRGATDRVRAVSLVISPPTPVSPPGSPDGLPTDSNGMSPLKTPTPGNPGGTPARSSGNRSLKNANSAGELRAGEDAASRSPHSGSSAHGRFSSVDSPLPLTQSPRASEDDGAASITSNQGSVVLGPMTPIVESPSVEKQFFGSMPNAGASNVTTSTAAASSTLLSAPDNSDAVSVYSVTTGKKKRPWRRSASRDPPPALPLGQAGSPSSPKDKRRKDRKPTGLAAALAASAMTMANPAVGPDVTGSISPPRRSNSISSATGPGAGGTRRSRRSGSQSEQAGVSAGGSQSANAVSNRHLIARQHQPRGSLDLPRSRPASVSSRSELDSDDEDDSESDELDLDLDADIPVTGFAVASNKRNADFHELFADIPEGDYLIEDYGCALARDILVQGRLYISENHLCFHANIFGWITDLTIPVYEIISIEKRMTALIIPNAIQVTTRDNKYTFASFMSRDTTYDVIHNVWRLGRPNSALTSADDLRRTGTDEARSTANVNGSAASGVIVTGAAAVSGGAARKATQCACGKAGQHLSATAMEATYPGTPEKIYNLMFASGFIKDFMRDDQKLQDIQVSDWAPTPDTKLLSRNMSYIKPLNGSIGPKETKCELKDETAHFDVEDYISTVTTTRTPNVPSGTVFSVKTRTCITWAGAVSAKVLVTTQVEWTGRSFIKGIIEKSALDGQMTYHKELDKAMRAYILAHPTEFIPEGVDAEAIEAAADEPKPEDAASATTTSKGQSGGDKDRERERRGRSLQLVWDTFEGAMGVAKRSAEGALDLLSDAWDGSSATTVLYFIIAFLVVSNVWTLTMMGRREEAGRRKAVTRADDRDKWAYGVMESLLEERAKLWVQQQAHPPMAAPAVPANPEWREEVLEIHKSLDEVAARVEGLRKGLRELE